ncbi:MFS transporter [Actinobacillus lignieresii]|uniref:Transport system permease n=1 Tax=Actinobacillus lignieresii TaxID=720 RepID=A0A380U1G3_ACTLI|nr:MFS transporter [Actinobacillus lignieresii]SUT94887.1 transport system permease [Actinobacillus lignieresii]
MNVQNIILWRRFFSGLAYTAMQSVFFIYLMKHKGFDTAQIASAFSLLVFASQAFSLFAGSWGDRYGRTPVMMLGCLLDALGYILLLTTHHYGLLLLATFCFGLGSTLFSTNARAFLLSNADDGYASKTKAQGKFLKISSMASMVAPLISIPFIHYQKAEWLIWCCCAIEVVMLLFMWRMMPRRKCDFRFAPFRFAQFKEVINKRFIFVHLLLFIPLGMGSAFYVIFPYIFTELLDRQELVPIAFFINNLIAVLLQTGFSRHINFGVVKLNYIAPILIALLIVPWFYALEYLSEATAFLYLVIFALVGLFANTALANMLVKLDRGENQGLMFGLSKLILAVTTAAIMNILPYIFLV